jgi:gliding motility-associated-like protein
MRKIICMKRILLLKLLLWSFCVQAQYVSWYAGVQGITGTVNGSVAVATFNNPHGVATDPLGNVYVADRYNHLIRKIDTQGNVITLAGSGNPGSANGTGSVASFNEPWGLCVDSLGNVYVADTKNNRIRKITPSGVVTTLAGTGNFGFTDNANPLAASFGNPTGICINESGELYIADHLTHLIRKIAPNGAVSTLAGNKIGYPNNFGSQNGTGSAARFYRPYGIDLDQQGNIIVADEWNHKIRKVTSAGVVTTIAGNGSPGLVDGANLTSSFNYPWDVTVDTSGNIYVADGYNYVIRKITNTGNVVSFAGTPGVQGAQNGFASAASFSGATTLEFNKYHNLIFIGDAYNHLIRTLTVTAAPNLNVTGAYSNVNRHYYVCPGSMVDVTIVPANFTRYIFYNNGNVVQDSTTATFSWQLSPSSIDTIFAQCYDSTGSLVSTVSVFIEASANAIPLITASPGATACLGDTIILTSNIPSGITWSTGDTSNSILIANPGQYILTGSGNNFCASGSDTIIVNFASQPVASINASSNTACTGDSILLCSQFPAGSYLWSTGDTDSSIIVTTSGQYYLLAANGSCADTSAMLSISFQQVNQPILNFNDTIYLPANDSILLFANQNNIVWNNGVASDSIYISLPGWYAASQVIGNCSATSDSILVIQLLAPINVSITPNNIQNACHGDSILLQSNFSSNIQWYHNGVPIAGATASSIWITSTGVYDIRSTNILQPLVSNIVTVNFSQPIVSTITSTYGANLNYQFNTALPSGANALWDFGVGNLTNDTASQANTNYQFPDTGTYLVTLLISFNGCTYTTTTNVRITYSKGDEVYIPTAFSPNQDGSNDVLYIRGEQVQNVKWLIFNPWGELVFEGVGQHEGWDGSYKGQPAQSNEYAYIVYFDDATGIAHVKKGLVTLLR